jgi:molybdopterin-containing oxidoreductase family membrane subunit
MTEIRTAVMIFSIGFLLFTFLSKIAIAIVFENYNIESLNPKKEAAQIRTAPDI